MPTYEYKCNACNREFEVQQRMSDPELTTCEACGQNALERLLSAPAFHLKGGGWYKDLYASSKPGAGSGAGSTDSSSSSSSGTSSSSDSGSTSSSSDSGSTSSSSSGASSSGSSTSGSSSTKAAAGAP